MEASSAAPLPAPPASAWGVTGHNGDHPMSKKSRHQAARSVTVASPVVESVVDTQELPVAPEAPTPEIPEAPVAEVPSAEVPEAPAAAETPTAVDTSYDPYAVSTPAPKGGRKYPRVGGKCWQVWNFCDEQVAAGVYVDVKLCREKATVEGWNVSNASQEFYGWRKFRGYGA